MTVLRACFSRGCILLGSPRFIRHSNSISRVRNYERTSTECRRSGLQLHRQAG